MQDSGQLVIRWFVRREKPGQYLTRSVPMYVLPNFLAIRPTRGFKGEAAGPVVSSRRCILLIDPGS